jgi:hypothetical protein
MIPSMRVGPHKGLSMGCIKVLHGILIDEWRRQSGNDYYLVSANRMKSHCGCRLLMGVTLLGIPHWIHKSVQCGV